MDGRCGIASYTKYLNDELGKLGVDINPIFVEPYRRDPLYYLRLAIRMGKMCDIAHIQFAYPFLGRLGPMTGIYIPLFYAFIWMLSHLFSFRVMTTMHNIWEERNPPKFRRLGSIYTSIVNKCVFRFSSCLIVLSESARDMLLRQGVSESKILVIPHGSKRPSLKVKKDCKVKIGLDPNKTVVTIFGYVKREKGHDLLVEAGRYIGNGAVLLIAGDDRAHDLKERKGYLEELKVVATDRTIFCGFVEENEVPLVLNATDIMVLPYREVRQSGVLNWSLAYKIPTITSDLPYFREIQRKYSCIRLFESGNVHSLVGAIRAVLNDEKLRGAMSRACEGYAEKNSFERAARATTSTYMTSLRR